MAQIHESVVETERKHRWYVHANCYGYKMLGRAAKLMWTQSHIWQNDGSRADAKSKSKNEIKNHHCS